MASVTLFMFFPFLIQYIVFLMKLENGSLIAQITHFLPSYHLFFEILALFYFVKPYREYWKGVFGNVRKYGKKEEVVPTVVHSELKKVHQKTCETSLSSK